VTSRAPAQSPLAPRFRLKKPKGTVVIAAEHGGG
jgi:hypothetical protein